jgi:mannose-6-phosphate isomerase-like protein (cupin superfamily)
MYNAPPSNPWWRPSLSFIQFDAESFDPKRITPVTHHLATHPAFAFENLLALARRLPKKQVRFHAATATAGSDFEKTVEEHKPQISVEDALANMETSGSWIALHNCQTDPAYKAVLDQVLDEVKTRIDAKDPGMHHRAFWIFIQSPGSVTPFHMDHEQNFLMQIRGKKLARVWHPEQCLSDYALEVFHSEHHRREVKYDESFNAFAHAFELEPGQGVYMPSTGPHLVHNGPNVSITVSMTYLTHETRRIETIHRGNHALRRLGIKPTPVGKAPRLDAVKNVVFRTALEARARLKGEGRDVPGWARY